MGDMTDDTLYGALQHDALSGSGPEYDNIENENDLVDWVVEKLGAVKRDNVSDARTIISKVKHCHHIETQYDKDLTRARDRALNAEKRANAAEGRINELEDRFDDLRDKRDEDRERAEEAEERAKELEYWDEKHKQDSQALKWSRDHWRELAEKAEGRAINAEAAIREVRLKLGLHSTTHFAVVLDRIRNLIATEVENAELRYQIESAESGVRLTDEMVKRAYDHFVRCGYFAVMMGDVRTAIENALDIDGDGDGGE